MKNIEHYLKPGAIVPVNNETTKALVDALKKAREVLAQPEQELVVLKRRLVKIHDALSNELGDTDPYINEDMTDEEICEEIPLFWAAKEIADLIGDAPWTDYTAPPQRTWVGLRDSQKIAIIRDCSQLSMVQLIELVEEEIRRNNNA